MDDKRTPMEAEVQELPQQREPVCPENFYGTSARPRPRRSHAGLWISVGLAVIALCTFSVVAAMSHVRLERRDGSLRLAMLGSEETKGAEEGPRDLDIPEGESYVAAQNGAGESVRLSLVPGVGESLSPSEIYRRVSAGVVCVQLDSYYGSSVNTGVVVSADGYILSASEGLTNTTGITVTLSDGSAYAAKRVGEERTSGVCLLKIEAQNLSAVSFSAGEETVGENVYCVCNPYGSQIPNLFYEGMLSACQSLRVSGTDYTILQSSAQLQQVGYGCPILDKRGRVLGLTTPIGQRIVSGDDPCFAVSARDLEAIVSAFEDADSSDSLWLGLEVSDIPEEYQFLYGFPGSVWIDGVGVGTAPDGVLYQYDVITAVDGTELTDAEAFEEIIDSHKAGDWVRLTIYRSGKWYSIQLPVTAR